MLDHSHGIGRLNELSSQWLVQSYRLSLSLDYIENDSVRRWINISSASQTEKIEPFIFATENLENDYHP